MPLLIVRIDAERLQVKMGLVRMVAGQHAEQGEGALNSGPSQRA